MSTDWPKTLELYCAYYTKIKAQVGIVISIIVDHESPLWRPARVPAMVPSSPTQVTRPPSSPSQVTHRIHGQAYDLTEWLPLHPGGAHLLEITRGTDCTELFESYHAPSLKEKHIRSTLKQYVVEGVEPTSTTYEWSDTPVYDDLKRVVRAYRRLHGIKATDSWAALAWLSLWGLVHYAALATWLLGRGGWPNAVVLGCSLWWWSGSLVHDGTHYALAYRSAASAWVGWLGGWMFCLPSAWLRQHVTGHHVHTNVEGRDPDLYHFKLAFRVAPFSAPGNKPLLAAVAPCLTQIVPWLLDSYLLWSRGRVKGTRQRVSWGPGERRQVGVSLVVSVAVVLRGIAAHRWAGLAPFGVVGVLFYAFSQVSHLSAASFEKPKSKEWAIQQIATTRGDYAYRSHLWNLLSVGLNNQAVHHCFPSVHPCHYPALCRLLQPIFAKHGLPRNGWEHTYWDALRLHLAHLRALN